MSIENEEVVIQRAQEGDQDALRELVTGYSDVVFRFAFNVCRDKDKAENTTQETFLSVVKNLKQFNLQSKFSTWLYTIVSNNCFMLARKNKSSRFVSIDDEEATVPEAAYVELDASPAELVERSDTRGLIDEAIDKLAPDYRIVFMLRDVEGLSTQEVSKVTNLSVAAVKSRLHRARAFLRNQLTPIFHEHADV
jgi:RNA polymerase sigma-70 factor, ECF subfamily